MKKNTNNTNTNNANIVYKKSIDTKAKKSINEKELEILKFWQDNKIFEKSVDNPAGVKDIGVREDDIQSFSFYDGPPFATGIPHHGHVLAGTIKDAIPRYQTMNGKRVRRVWGWDCHGLPIENLIEKELNLNSKKEIEIYGVDKFNKAASDSVLRYESEWKNIIPRLGRWVDMDHAYKTMDATYTESVWWSWKQLYDRGLAYEGHKIMHICPRCETPLAQSEVGLEYNDVTDLSVTVEFELLNKKHNDKPLYILAWTTTPWTLPGNTALAVNKSIDYVIVESKYEDKINYFIVAKKRMEHVFVKSESHKIVEEINIQDYIGEKYSPVFECFNNEKLLSELENSDNLYKIWHADFITDDSGTGIAHEAPAFGTEDMELAKANNIPIIKHVNMNGSFIKEVEETLPELAGLVVKKKNDSISTDIEIVKLLAHSGKLFSKEKIVHSYPLCWRCKTPLLNYATSSWFVDVPQIKDKLIAENKKIKWIPEHIRDGRFGRWLEGAREWAVSRARYWGAPLPIWRSIDGQEIKVIGSIEEIAQPSKNKYFVMRHGEALYNVHGQEKYDSSNRAENHLTKDGVSQVKVSAEKLKDKNIDIIICSPFVRTKETAEIVCDIVNLDKTKIVYDDRLREHGLGELDGKSFDDVHKIIFTKLGNNLNCKEHGIESWNEMSDRARSLMLETENKYEGKNILVITHLGIVKSIINNGLFKTENQISKEESSPNYRAHTSYVPTGEFKEVEWKVVPRDETGAINLHRPYIDEVVLRDSRGVEMRRIPDVFDCWYESGSMPYAQIHFPFENKDVFYQNYPANFIAEGMDQTRGWFYSLINLGVSLNDSFRELSDDKNKFDNNKPAPYQNVIVNGVVMADDGRKMSKSEKNYTDPMELVEKYGADALRLALANSPVMQGENVYFTDDLVEDAYKKNIMKLENMLEFYLQNSSTIEVFDLNKSNTEYKITNVLDIWVLEMLVTLIVKVTKGYQDYKIDDAVRPIEMFIDDVSTWYLRRSRDRMKGVNGDLDKVLALATFKYVLMSLSKLLAPIAPFIAERIYTELNGDKESVHLESWPKSSDINLKTKLNNIGKEDEYNANMINQMLIVRNICSQLLMLRQKLNIPVRQPLASATINKELDIELLEIIKEEVNVKIVLKDMSISEYLLDSNIDEELRREGDQRELSRAIKDMRRDMGLVASDSIAITIDAVRSALIDDKYQKEMKIVNIKVIEGNTETGGKLVIDKA